MDDRVERRVLLAAICIALLVPLVVIALRPRLGIPALVAGLVVAVGTFHANLARAYALLGRRAEAALKRARSLGYEQWRDIQRRIESVQAR